MSIRALHSAASGMSSLQFNLDTIANNLANAGTTAFKRSRTNFEDIYYQQLKLPGQLNQQSLATAIGIQVGTGSRVQGTQLNFEQGSLLSTNADLDIAITGDGFFQVTDGNSILYTRAGNFARNSQGQIVMASADRGYLLEPQIVIPQDATNVSVSPDGIVTIQQPNQLPQQVGTITLAKFVNPTGLLQIGENLYRESQASGTPLLANPGGIEGIGSLRQRFLESSNVDPATELVDLIKTQRNFELNGQVVQAADQTLQLITNLRRF